MRLAIFGVVVCLAAGCAGIAEAREFAGEPSPARQTLRFAAGPGSTLEIRAITGTITVEAYDGREVEMIIDKTIHAHTDDGRRAAERDVALETSGDGSAIRAIVRYRNFGICGEKEGWSGRWFGPRYEVRYDFTIRVPREMGLNFCTINDGEITIKGTRGPFTVRSVNGHITMTDVAGAGEAVTVNGRVTASFVAAPGTPSLFKTINGDVVVTMPDRLSADLRMKTFNGGLYTDFDVQPVPVRVSAAPERRGGMLRYRSNEFTTVRVGRGGPELTLETLNGDVRVLRASK